MATVSELTASPLMALHDEWQRPDLEQSEALAIVQTVYDLGLSPKTVRLLLHLNYFDFLVTLLDDSASSDDPVDPLTLSICRLCSLDSVCLTRLCNDSHFGSVFDRALHAVFVCERSFAAAATIYDFLTAAFAMLHYAPVRRAVSPVVSAGIFSSLDGGQRSVLLDRFPTLAKSYASTHQRYEATPKGLKQDTLLFQHSWLASSTLQLMGFLTDLPADSKEAGAQPHESFVSFVSSALRFVILLLSQVPTRRYTGLLFRSLNLLVAVRQSPLLKDHGKQLDGLVQALSLYLHFPVDDLTGRWLAADEVRAASHADLERLQQAAHKLYPEKLYLLALSSIDGISVDLLEHLMPLADDELFRLASHLGIHVYCTLPSLVQNYNRVFLLDCFVQAFGKRPNVFQTAISTNVLASSTQDLVQSPVQTLGLCLSFGLQYLSMADFLLRSFYNDLEALHRDMREAMLHVLPSCEFENNMDNEGNESNDAAVKPNRWLGPLLSPLRTVESGSTSSTVEALVLIQGKLVLSPGDVVFLALIKPGTSVSADEHSILENVLNITPGQCVRMVSQEARETSTSNTKAMVHIRIPGSEHVNFNAVVIPPVQAWAKRLACLELTQQLLKAQSQGLVIAAPTWLNDAFLGFGDLEQEPTFTVDLLDTVSETDLKALFPDCLVEQVDHGSNQAKFDQGKLVSVNIQPSSRETSLPSECIRAVVNSLRPGISLFVTSPGSPMTATAAQIIKLWYHNFAKQRTLIIGKFGHSLDDIMDQLKSAGVHESHVLRLGQGSSTGFGRIEEIESRLHHLLQQVEALARSMKQSQGHGESCTSALYFGESLKPWTPQLAQLFEAIESLQPFEVLRSTAAKSEYLLKRRARVIAVSYDYLVAHWRDFVGNGAFRAVDNVVAIDGGMADDGIESLLPVVTSGPKQRLVLIGDLWTQPGGYHSLFRRLYELNNVKVVETPASSPLASENDEVPSVARRVVSVRLSGHQPDQSLSRRVVSEAPSRPRPSAPTPIDTNAGFLHRFQVVTVPPLQGEREVSISLGAIVNRGEAEYAVCVYQYMRLLNYPRQDIVILALTEAQKGLIVEIASDRCVGTPFADSVFGLPRVQTIAEHAGQSSAYAVVSLVKSHDLGPLADDRMVRAVFCSGHKGLYVFCSADLLEYLVISQYLVKDREPTLQLVTGEMYGAIRSPDPNAVVAMAGVAHLAHYVYDMAATREAYEKRGR